jgi:hypothetical protein
MSATGVLSLFYPGWKPFFPGVAKRSALTPAKVKMIITTRKSDNRCVTDGDVVEGDSNAPIITFELSSVDACEFPYDEVDCPAP